MAAQRDAGNMDVRRASTQSDRPGGEAVTLAYSENIYALRRSPMVRSDCGSMPHPETRPEIQAAWWIIGNSKTACIDLDQVSDFLGDGVGDGA